MTTAPQLSRRTVLALLTMTPALAWASDETPETIVRTLIDAMAANDAPAIRVAFAEDAKQAYGAGAPKSGEAFRAWLESDIIELQGRVEAPRFRTNGTTVTVTGTYRNDNGYSSEASFLFTVRGGRIVAWHVR